MVVGSARLLPNGHKNIVERRLMKHSKLTCIVVQEANDALSKTADSDTVLTYQVSSVQLVTDKKLEAFNKAWRSKLCFIESL